MTEATTTTPVAVSRWRGAHHYAAPALVLVAMVVTFLRFHEYSLLLPESLVLLGAVVSSGLILGALGRLRPETLGCAVIALVLAFYVFHRPEVTDPLFVLAGRWTDTLAYARQVLTVIGVGIFLVSFVVCVLLKRHLALIVTAVFGTMVVSTVVLPVGTGGEAKVAGAIPAVRADLPPVIHIVLDEHAGLDALPAEYEESAIARRAIEATYKDFELFARAYSRFAETKYALTSLLNGNLGMDVADMIASGWFVFTPRRNDWFDALKRQGYAIQVYQTAWFDMCGSPAVDSCYTYSLFSPNVLQRTPVSTGVRLRVLAEKLFFGTHRLQTGTLASTEALQQFSADIGRAPRGVAYVLHLLMPHHDYFYEADCSLADPADWERQDYGEDHAFAPAERDDLYDRYLGQLICTQARINAVFARLKEIGVYDEATIIIHGDHGSRIGRIHYIADSPDLYSDQDVLDHFATLLAIRAPGVTAGIRHEPVALQQIFARRFLGDTPAAQGEDILVHLRGDDDRFGPRGFVWSSAVAGIAAAQAAAAQGTVER